MKKWLIYQKERFPILAYLPMMAVFGFSGLSYSMHLNNPDARISDTPITSYVVAILVTLFWFMLIRIADEHKDFEEDSEHRPYLPVQRGLITLKELRFVGISLGIIQVILLILIDWRLIFMLAVVYLWFFLMCKEFFVAKWLKNNPTWYLISHMLIMFFITFLITSIEWLPRGGFFHIGILLYMISSFCDGTVIEVGRKLRAKENEEYGVDTYTQIWGPGRAMVFWLICMTISGTSTVLAAFQVGVGMIAFGVLLIFYLYAIFIAMRFGKKPTPQNAKVFKVFPGLWMMLMYVILGIVPFFV
jgi:4-hydroxybenzoate polyprenyltransferase